MMKGAEVSSVKSAPSGQEAKEEDYLSSMFPDQQLPRLYKFESEDSGVEMPSGANSPSTPTGSEQSFVVHSRESSRDSGALGLTSPLPTQDPLLLLEAECAEMLQRAEMELEMAQLEETVIADGDLLETDLTEVDGMLAGAEEEDQEGECQKEEGVVMVVVDEEEVVREAAQGSNAGMERPDDGPLRHPSVDRQGEGEPEQLVVDQGEGVFETMAVTEEVEEDLMRARTDGSGQACEDADVVGGEFQAAPLRKSTTSDSLDQYMEECCRLSEVRPTHFILSVTQDVLVCMAQSTLAIYDLLCPYRAYISLFFAICVLYCDVFYSCTFCGFAFLVVFDQMFNDNEDVEVFK